MKEKRHLVGARVLENRIVRGSMSQGRAMSCVAHNWKFASQSRCTVSARARSPEAFVCMPKRDDIREREGESGCGGRCRVYGDDRRWTAVIMNVGHEE